ncbi:MAG: hypothetical protein NT009_09880 [Proteobacteria bacterium]|nr:hypothetical protein [Pseudomonadota bacterium]
MKILGLKPIELAPGVTALNLAEFKLPLDFVMGNKIINLPYLNTGNENLPFKQPGFMTEEGFVPVRRLAVLRKGRRFSFTGIFIYGKLYDLAEYLVRCYLPLSSSTVDSLIKRLRGKTRKKNLVSEIMGDIENHPLPTSHLRFNRGEDAVSWFPCLEEKGLERTLDFEIFELSGQKMYLKIPGHRYGSRLWIWENSHPAGKNGVPRYNFILVHGRQEKAILWNGEKIEVKPAESIEKKDLGDFEKQGFIVSGRNFDPLPRPELKVELLLRVPSFGEVRKPVRPGREAAVPPGAEKPLYIFDLKRAIRIDPDPKIIQNPWEVLPILARTKNNIYVPGDALTDTGTFLQDKPYFLAAMRVAGKQKQVTSSK